MKKELNHIGVIIDGNRRWAKERGLDTLEGHKKGFDNAKKLVQWAFDRKIKKLSIFTFSTENWDRSKREVTYLMDLIYDFMKKFLEEKDPRKDKIKIKVLGLKNRISAKMKKMIDRVEKETKNNKGMILNVAFNYGAKEEIVDTVNRLIESKKKVTKKNISDNLWNTDLDLVIRSGGEQRLSNFFIWETAYAELLFVKKYWPAFTEKDFEKAIEWYNSRSRRFGK